MPSPRQTTRIDSPATQETYSSRGYELIPIKDYLDNRLLSERALEDERVGNLRAEILALRNELAVAAEGNEKALQAALLSAEKAINAANVAAEKAINAASLAAEKAILAALSAAEKLEQERIGGVKLEILSLRNELAVAAYASKEAIDIAKAANEKRLDGMNEFRQSLTDQNATYMPRIETEQRFNSLGTMVADVKDRQTSSDAKGIGQTHFFNYLVAGFAMLASIVAVIMAFVKH
jgi:hypothetical protein